MTSVNSIETIFSFCYVLFVCVVAHPFAIFWIVMIVKLDILNEYTHSIFFLLWIEITTCRAILKNKNENRNWNWNQLVVNDQFSIIKAVVIFHLLMINAKLFMMAHHMAARIKHLFFFLRIEISNVKKVQSRLRICLKKKNYSNFMSVNLQCNKSIAWHLTNWQR